MRIFEIIPEGYVGQKSPISGGSSIPKKKRAAVEKVEDLAEGPIWDKVKKAGAIGATAAALAGGAAPGVNAAPFQHNQVTDQMSGDNLGGVSSVKSDNSNAKLEIHYGQQKLVVIDIPKATINYGVDGADVRIKIGNGPVQTLKLSQPDSGSYSWGGIVASSGLISKILSHNGEFKIEVPIYREGPKVFKFTIEADKVSQAVSSKTQSKPTTTNQSVNTAPQTDAETPVSPSYTNRAINRIAPNIQTALTGTTTVKISANDSGSITNATIIKPSGNPEFDSAIVAAVKNTAVLPRDENGRVPKLIELTISK